MPINPVSVENPYGLPPLNGGDDLPSDPTERARLEMMRSIAENSRRPGADQGALARALSAASTAVPMSEWKPPVEPLPISRKDQVRTVLDSRERQLRSLESFASDPKNPVSQDEVARIRDQIEAESQRALQNATLPSPVSMYETLVDAEEPEVARARVKDNLLTVPGFKREWSAFVSFDENNQPVYPKWMEKPMESAMAKAMGVADDEAATQAQEAAATFAENQLKRAEPKLKDYDGDIEAFDTDHNAWEQKMLAHIKRFNPEAAALLPTFAEEQGFAQPGAAPAQSAPTAPTAVSFDEEEVRQLQMRFEANNTPTAVAKSADDLRSQIASGDISPGDVVIVSTPAGAVAMKLQADGQFRQVGRYSSRQ